MFQNVKFCAHILWIRSQLQGGLYPRGVVYPRGGGLSHDPWDNPPQTFGSGTFARVQQKHTVNINILYSFFRAICSVVKLKYTCFYHNYKRFCSVIKLKYTCFCHTFKRFCSVIQLKYTCFHHNYKRFYSVNKLKYKYFYHNYK